MVAFIVLHYNDYDVTIQCVDKLLALDNMDGNMIVIVDNGSPNKSGRLLKEKYEFIKNIVVIEVDTNVGFAKGNNIGYHYAKRRYSPDYIVVMNNDVMVEQKNFLEILNNNCELKEYEIIMPDIINMERIHQNPFREKPLSNHALKKNYIKIQLLLIIYHIPILNILWCNRNKYHNRIRTEVKKYTRNDMMIPHGACIIFTKKWIMNEDIAFIPDTFLYGEEDILYEYIMNKKYKTYYEKSLRVIHIEDVSTKSVLKTDLKKAQFLFRNSYQSQKVLINLRKYNNKNKSYIVRGDQNE